MNTFTVNNKRYEAVPFDFNTICDLEDFGVSMSDMQKKAMSATRAYFALCTPSRDLSYAGNEMQAHIISGGKFDDIIKAMTKEMTESDFFRAMQEKSEKNSRTRASKKEQSETEE